MPLQQTSGNVTADAYGGGVAVVPAYIEECFSTYLYTGTAATLAINNGLDLATKGGLTWLKSRSLAGSNNWLINTVNGVNSGISSNSAGAATTTDFSSFNTNGFTLGSDVQGGYNNSGATFVSWSFVKKPKFFTIATWTGTGANQNITHDLGSVPGCILVKKTSSGGVAWAVYHRSLANTEYLVLNTTAATATDANRWDSTTATSTVFSLGTDATVNASGASYTAFIYAHDAGGFGLTGTDNVISCGSYTGSGSSGTTVNLGYEPQWVMIKKAADPAGNGPSGWVMMDNMRGLGKSYDNALTANTSSAEAADVSVSNAFELQSTGFKLLNANGALNVSTDTYIYIAIRRGPMKVPTDATKVFALGANGLGSAGGNLGNLSASDLAINTQRAISGSALSSPKFVFMDRLRGVGQINTGNTTVALYSNSTAAETTVSSTSSTGTGAGTNGAYLASGSDLGSPFNSAIRNIGQGDGGNVGYAFLRAPSFFDEVCYTGDGTTNRQISHNLGVKPELLISKSRSNGSANWTVQNKSLVNQTSYLLLQATDKEAPGGGLTDFSNTTSTYFLGNGGSANYQANVTGQTYVAYLFATCAGVSKVGSYTGNGTTQTIDCGFTGGARFVLIKRTDLAGGWYTYDTARGMTVLTDPYLLLNSTAAEVATLGSVTTVTTGFALNSTILADINVSAGSYIFLAIS